MNWEAEVHNFAIDFEYFEHDEGVHSVIRNIITHQQMPCSRIGSSTLNQALNLFTIDRLRQAEQVALGKSRSYKCFLLSG